jgi:hypothetical protein
VADHVAAIRRNLPLMLTAPIAAEAHIQGRLARIESSAAALRAEVEALRAHAGMTLPTQRVLRYVSWEESDELLALARALIDHIEAGKLAKRVCDLLVPGALLARHGSGR